MSEKEKDPSRTHDLLGASLGGFALVMLVSSPWQVDSSGPDPFYKGPLIFPLLVLSMMVLASLPFWKRLLTPPEKASWHLDGQGIPWKTIRVLGLLVGYLGGLLVVGLEAATALFLVAALWMVGERTWPKLAFVPLGVTAVLYLFFKYILDVWFPEPLLMQMLGG